MYGFQSYISMPILHKDGRFFGILCAIDPRPARLKNPETIGMFKLFVELIASHLDSDEELQASVAALRQEQHLSKLHEQFIAVLGHNLHNGRTCRPSYDWNKIQEICTKRSRFFFGGELLLFGS
jgi:hypothetical protein